MQRTVTKLENRDMSLTFEPTNFCVGQIIQITEQGRAVVDYPGNPIGPIEARSIIADSTKVSIHPKGNLPVLLVFEDGNPALPIIIGIVHDTLYSTTATEEVTLPIERPRDSIIDGKRIILDAKQEIMLRCGKSIVILRKDGKVVIRGIQITSRASRTHKIRGAAVKIN